MTVSAHRERRPTAEPSGPLPVDLSGRHISIISVSLGAGHDAAAKELARRLTGAGASVERHDLLDLLPFGLGRRTKRLYELQLRVAPSTWGWTMRSLERFQLLTTVSLWIVTILAGRRVRRAVSGDLDAVVTTYPMANHALARLRRRGRLRCPLVTYLVNMAAHRVWVARGVDLYLAPSEVSAHHLRRMGARDVRVAGLPVSPAFAPPLRTAAEAAAERRAARERFGLPLDAPLALVMAGAWAVGDVLDTARDIAATDAAVPVTVCAHNDELRRSLTDEGVGAPLGWVDDMPSLVRACDVVISNAGGASALEALVAQVPLISYRCVPGHGVDNAVALAEAGLAPLVGDRAELTEALRAACGGAARHPGLGLAGNPDPALMVVGAMDTGMDTGMVPVRRHRLARRLVATTAAVVAGLWLATAGTGAAVAHGFRAARPSHADSTNVYLVVALPDDRATDPATLESLVKAHAAVAVSQSMAERQPATVQAAALAGLELVNAGPGRPYETGVVHNRRTLGRTAVDIHRLTGQYPRLLLSDGSLDAIDVMAASWYHERILIPDNAHESGADPDSIRGGKVVLVSCYGQSSCQLDSLLDKITVQAGDKSLSLAPTAELAT
jgi:UDP-N-acetylglucosamine:LPS N-acetylglucosamine transferase